MLEWQLGTVAVRLGMWRMQDVAVGQLGVHAEKCRSRMAPVREGFESSLEGGRSLPAVPGATCWWHQRTQLLLVLPLTSLLPALQPNLAKKRRRARLLPPQAPPLLPPPSCAANSKGCGLCRFRLLALLAACSPRASPCLCLAGSKRRSKRWAAAGADAWCNVDAGAWQK